MALFGGKRDISVFNKFNRELISRVMDTVVHYFKISLTNTSTNIYGEGVKKVFNDPVEIHCVIAHEDQSTAYDQFGTDVAQTVTFSFFSGILKDADIYPEPGDIVQWNNGFYEIDSVIQNQLVVGKNPDGQLSHTGEDFGQSHSFICSAHLTRMSNIDIKQHRYGISGDYLEGNQR